MSAYSHNTDYSDIHTIVSQIFWHIYEHVKNVFSMSETVSIDAKLYTWKIGAYGI